MRSNCAILARLQRPNLQSRLQALVRRSRSRILRGLGADPLARGVTEADRALSRPARTKRRANGSGQGSVVPESVSGRGSSGSISSGGTQTNLEFSQTAIGFPSFLCRSSASRTALLSASSITSPRPRCRTSTRPSERKSYGEIAYQCRRSGDAPLPRPGLGEPDLLPRAGGPGSGGPARRAPARGTAPALRCREHRHRAVHKDVAGAASSQAGGFSPHLPQGM